MPTPGRALSLLARSARPLSAPLLAALGSCALGGYAGARLLGSMNDPVPAVLGALREREDREAPASPPGARLVVVLIDGLGEAALGALLDAGRGGTVSARIPVAAELPSLSRPAYHALLTGVPPWASGIRANGPARGRADSLPDRVRASGGRVGWMLETVPWFHELFGQPEDTLVEGPAALSDASFARVLGAGARLVVVHLTEPDGAGHAEGSASAAYLRAGEWAMDVVRSFRERAAGLPAIEGTRWFVGADHGHLARGGHGGPEAGARSILWAELGDPPAGGAVTLPGRAPLAALAPTLAAAMGLGAPRSSLCDPLPLPGLEVRPSAERDARRAAVAERASAHAAGARRSLAARALGALVVILAAAAWAGPRRFGGALLVASAASLSFFALGPGSTLSAIRTAPSFLIHASLALAAGACAAWPAARRRGATAAWVLGLAGLVPLTALLVTGGSLGLSLAGERGLLLFPAAGLLPTGVALGVLGTEAARALARRVGRAAR